MSTSPSARGPQLERRDRFRNYMRSFNPTAPARNVIAAGLVYEELHHKLYSNLAGRADLEPGSQQLLVGGIGSGKTVELLLAAQWFTREVDGLVLYIDITAETDLSGLNSGSLLASFGVHLARRVSHDKAVPKRDLEAITQRIREYAYGKKQKVWVSLDDEDWEPESDGDEEGDENRGYFTFREIPGKLKPPLPVLRRDVREISKPLEELLAASKSFYKDILVVFDGLDRLLAPVKFWEVVNQNLRLFRQLGVSILATAPLSVLFGVGVGQAVSESFRSFHRLVHLLLDPKHEFLQSDFRKTRWIRLIT